MLLGSFRLVDKLLASLAFVGLAGLVLFGNASLGACGAILRLLAVLVEHDAIVGLGNLLAIDDCDILGPPLEGGQVLFALGLGRDGAVGLDKRAEMRLAILSVNGRVLGGHSEAALEYRDIRYIGGRDRVFVIAGSGVCRKGAGDGGEQEEKERSLLRAELHGGGRSR